MKSVSVCLAVWAACLSAGPAGAAAQATGELRVHLVQANNDSPYAFVRAKFQPGEVSDPWAVRFFDEKGAEVPYFVWDSVTWQVAREGRADWGHRFALLNHAAGQAPDVLEARGRKLEWARQHLPELGARLAAEDEAAKRAGNSVCAALYLLRHRAPAYAKERLPLRIYPSRQVEPRRTQWKGRTVTDRPAVSQGDLGFRDLPDRLGVTWKGKELFRYAGFDAGGTADAAGHADPSRPFAMETQEGIITRLYVRSQTQGRQGGVMDWQCTYWLFPEGSYVALEGFSLSDTAGYIGGQQRLSLWQGAAEFAEKHEPLWESPWWLHQVGDRGFVATHLFHSTPLAIGYGNNPFTVNSYAPPGRAPKVEATGNQLALYWSCALDDLAIARLLAPELYYRLGRGYASQPETGRNWFDGNKEVVLAGKIARPPEWMTPDARRFVEEQLKVIQWQPKIDWLYRQYAVGVGEGAAPAEAALRALLGAAAGWIDRPADEEEIAALLVENARSLSDDAALKWSREMQVLPHLLNPDPAGLKTALARWPDETKETDRYIELMQNHIAAGGNPIADRTGGLTGDRRGEGWIVNPSYHATQLPYYIRFLQHFDLPYPEDEYRQALLKYADYSLQLLGGKPLDPAKLRQSYLSHWPSRFVAIVPLALAAYQVKPDKDYTQAATIMFDILWEMVDRNPQGYWSAWAANPTKAELFDTVYNGATVQRGLPAFWADGMLDLVGRDRASHFVAAQARYVVFSGQFLDTFEADNTTAIYATKHGGHPAERKQIPIFLYDDFEFYRGLVADLVRWAAANPTRAGGRGDLAAGSAERELGLAESGCYLLRWGLGMGAGADTKGKSASASRWFEYKVDRLPETGGLRLRIWNRLPWPQSTLALGSQDIGLKPAEKGAKGGPQQVLWLRLDGPAYRTPYEIEVAPKQGAVAVKISKGLRLRLYWRPLCPDWPPDARPALLARRPDGSTETLSTGVTFGGGFVEWQPAAGSYEIKPAGP